MGVMAMENFNLASLDALLSRGFLLPDAPRLTRSIVQVTDDGLTRPTLQVTNALSGGSGARSDPILGIPIPTTKFGYVSVRFRVTTDNIRHNLLLGTTSNMNNWANFWWYTLGVVNTTAGSQWPVAAGNWTTVEAVRTASGSLKVWVDDFLVTTLSETIGVPPENFLYLNSSRSTSIGAADVTLQVSDIIVVDPATPGLQYRAGASSRIVSLVNDEDLITEWTPPAGVTDPHFQIVADYPSVVSDDDVLTGVGVGVQELYGLGAVPAGAKPVVKVVGIERVVQNPGGMVRTLAQNVDMGAGVVEVAATPISPGVPFTFSPVFLDKKPDGSNWTMADLANFKSGYSIKS